MATRLRGLVVLGAIFGVGTIIVGAAVAATDGDTAHGQHLITVHDRGSEKVFVSSATTIAEALKRNDISIASADSVEPGLSTQLVASNYYVNIYRARPVLIVDGETRLRVMTPHQSSNLIAKNARLTLYSEDKTAITTSTDTLNDGAALILTIDRATPFNFVLYGKQITARSHATTVADYLQEKKIVLQKDDRLNIPQTSLLQAGMTLEIWREGKQTINQDVPVAFSVEQIQDVDREIGYRAVQVAGSNGQANVTYEIVIRNGLEISRQEIARVVTLQPKKQVEVVGAKPSFGGSFGEALAQLRACEAGGRYDRNSGNGYYGAYQYDIGTWGGYGGYPNASVAPPAVQDQKVFETYQRRGWSPWPSCGASLPDTYR